VLTACGRGYSEGERSGIVFKFSNKGLIWKSWEGEMNLGGVRAAENGAVANTWKFTLKDDRLLTQIQNAIETGDAVRLRYVQWTVAPLDMESDYEIVAVLPRKLQP